MSATSRLHEALADAGLPVVGVSGDALASLRLDFAPGTTDVQVAAANSLAASFDFTSRRPRTISSLLAAISNLTSADRTKLLAAVAADLLRRNPRFAKRLGIDIEGDEPDV